MFYVDLPRVDDSCNCVGEFDTREEAVAWIREHVGVCDDFGNLCLLSEFPDEEESNIEVVRGSLLDQDVEVIVNAANPAMRGGSGINGMVHHRAGPELMKELTEAAPNGVPVATPVLTKGYGLKQPHVIHVAGPYWTGGQDGEPALLADCYRRSLAMAQEHGFQSVGFCSISTGIFGYPLELAAPLVLATVRSWLEDHPGTSVKRVVFAMFGAEEYEVFANCTKGEQ